MSEKFMSAKEICETTIMFMSEVKSLGLIDKSTNEAELMSAFATGMTRAFTYMGAKYSENDLQDAFHAFINERTSN